MKGERGEARWLGCIGNNERSCSALGWRYSFSFPLAPLPAPLYYLLPPSTTGPTQHRKLLFFHYLYFFVRSEISVRANACTLPFCHAFIQTLQSTRSTWSIATICKQFTLGCHLIFYIFLRHNLIYPRRRHQDRSTYSILRRWGRMTTASKAALEQSDVNSRTSRRIVSLIASLWNWSFIYGVACVRCISFFSHFLRCISHIIIINLCNDFYDPVLAHLILQEHTRAWKKDIWNDSSWLNSKNC